MPFVKNKGKPLCKTISDRLLFLQSILFSIFNTLFISHKSTRNLKRCKASGSEWRVAFPEHGYGFCRRGTVILKPGFYAPLPVFKTR